MEKMIIGKIDAQEILDSRGNPTVECTVYLTNGVSARASVPSGASTGEYEAHELRDGDPNRFGGLGVQKAVTNIQEVIQGELRGRAFTDIREVDEQLIQLDGTADKSRLGANSMLAVSLAVARATAQTRSTPLYRYIGGIQAVHLPVPMMNILNGGAHAANNLDIQEFMILPTGATSFHQGLRQCAEIYQRLKAVLRKKGLSTGVGDEGGFAPDLSGDAEALELILEAVEVAGYVPGRDIELALDVAASEWITEKGYRLPKSGEEYDTASLITHYEELCRKYPICSIEDPLGENDFAGFSKMTKEIGRAHMIVGDDLFVTNSSRLARGIREKAGNAILVKVNQIGTLSEALQAIHLAKRSGFQTIISHRSGETEDTFIADLAVGVNAEYIKAGAPCRTERVCKYNRLLRIEKELGATALFGAE